jgi:hypothetical protein
VVKKRKISTKKRPLLIKKEKVLQREILLTEKDRINYIYKRDSLGKVIEVTNVSYDINIRDEWVTIVRYDSSHGILHVHRKISFTDPRDTPSTLGVKRKGDHTKWLTWAISDIKSKFEDYKRGFLKRSNLRDIDTD